MERIRIRSKAEWVLNLQRKLPNGKFADVGIRLVEGMSAEELATAIAKKLGHAKRVSAGFDPMTLFAALRLLGLMPTSEPADAPQADREVKKRGWQHVGSELDDEPILDAGTFENEHSILITGHAADMSLPLPRNKGTVLSVNDLPENDLPRGIVAGENIPASAIDTDTYVPDDVDHQLERMLTNNGKHDGPTSAEYYAAYDRVFGKKPEDGSGPLLTSEELAGVVVIEDDGGELDDLFPMPGMLLTSENRDEALLFDPTQPVIVTGVPLTDEQRKATSPVIHLIVDEEHLNKVFPANDPLAASSDLHM